MQEQTIFIEALEKEDPVERAAFLDRACANDPVLRQRIERLLERHQQSDSFLELPPAAPGATIDAPSFSLDVPAVSERPGTVIGPYKLLQQIGEGGMGTVFLAEQSRPVQRQVALKIIKPGMDSRQVIARFEAERQALALMDHPNIAKVLDAGTTDTGRLFFAMELVKGVPITLYCDEHHLTCKERLELFMPVCQAVQHAHQKGIIHRDIKPSNVLIALYDDKPVAKVIDFGIAKATGQKLTDRTLFTEFGQVVGTLEYMSPEQAGLNHLDIDTRSDLYSLGVLLYELLTGTTPLERKRLREVAMLEMLRLIREEEPPRPSTRLSTTDGMPMIAANRGLEPKKLSGLVRGELDWIVMKALEKDRNRRYETANGFALDVQRYLADEPVQACPPSQTYRLKKFLRRNKGPVLAVSLVLLALVGGIIGTTLGLLHAQESAEAERLAKIDVLEKQALAEKSARAERAARNALDSAREETDQQRKRTDRELSAVLVEAAGLREKARTARPGDQVPWNQLRETMRRAETLAESELADPVLVGRVQTLTAELKQGEANRKMVARLEEIRMDPSFLTVSDGRRPAYEAAFREYGVPLIDLSVEEAARRIAASSIRDQLVAALDDCASHDKEPCERLLPIALRVVDDPWRQQYFEARIRKNLPALLKLAKQPESLAQPPATICMLAKNLQWQDNPIALGLFRDVQRQHPGDIVTNSNLGILLTSMSMSHPSKNRDRNRDLTESAGFFRAALAANPENVTLHNLLADTFMLRTDFLAFGFGADEASAIYRQSLWLKPDDFFANFGLGQVYSRMHQIDKALPHFSKALEVQPNHQKALYWRGSAYLSNKQYDKAIADFSRLLALDPKNAGGWHMRGFAFKGLGQSEKALADFSKAIELDPSSVQNLQVRAQMHLDGGQWNMAIADYAQVLVSKPDDINLLHKLTWLLLTHPDPTMRDPARALQLAKKALSIQPKFGPLSRLLGIAHYRAGDWKDAIVALDRSLASSGGHNAAFDFFFLAMAHQQLGNREEALKRYGFAVRWLEKNSHEVNKDLQRAQDFRRFQNEAEEVLELKKK